MTTTTAVSRKEAAILEATSDQSQSLRPHRSRNRGGTEEDDDNELAQILEVHVLGNARKP
jgi:hypothetical protein